MNVLYYSRSRKDELEPKLNVKWTSRGKTVDQKALINALESNSIAGAALDVTDPEPIEMDSKLLSMQNVLIVPHISSASTKTIENMGLMAAKNIILGLTGKEMLSCINEDKTK